MFVKGHRINLGRVWSSESRAKIAVSNRSRVVSLETRVKMSVAQKKRLRKKESLAVCEAKRLRALGRCCSVETRRKMSKSHLGELAPNWRGGITVLHRKLRNTLDYRLWREAVFKRDDWTCQFCFVRGGKLNADHIQPFSLFPDLRLDVSNGRTLCEACHRKTDTYARGACRVILVS